MKHRASERLEAGPDVRRNTAVVRAPNHLGDVVMALPALARQEADVLVVRSLEPIVRMAGLTGEVIAFDRGPAGFVSAVRELRRRRYRSGFLMTPSFSAAWLMRCGGVRRLRGTATDGRSLLLRDRVAVASLRDRHRIAAFQVLLGQRPEGSPTSCRLKPSPALVDRWRSELAPGSSTARPLLGLIPGAHAPARRWPVARFATLAHRLRKEAAIVVLGGASERHLTAQVARQAPGAVDLGGRTTLSDLAALLHLCDLVVTNDTGPMHLAGAVGTPTVSLWGSSDPDEVRQLGAPDVRMDGPGLPCRPCRRNRCMRRGAGTLLADAHEECMRLIEIEEVVRTVKAALVRSANSPEARR